MGIRGLFCAQCEFSLSRLNPLGAALTKNLRHIMHDNYLYSQTESHHSIIHIFTYI